MTVWVWIVLGILFAVFIAEKIINNWNNDPLGNRNRFKRPKNAQFKTYYGVTEKQSISTFEHNMTTGMFCERKEIFVTAFCRDSVVERVTASIGSDFRCSNADDVRKWPNHAKRLNCNEIRQYHNHPNFTSRERVSYSDMKTHNQIAQYFSNSDTKFRSFLIYANFFKGWEIKEFNGSNNIFPPRCF